MSNVLEIYDGWLKDDSDVAALVMRQWLVPVEGKDSVVFPPTYTLAETEIGDRFNKGEPIPGVYKGQNGPMGYNIDRFPDGTSVCLIDSIGSQANRMEPIFMRDRYKKLVPQVVVKVVLEAGEQTVNLLEAGHRAADAIVRFSGLRQELEKAFEAVGAGDASKLAKIAPTSLVFGVWDSRGTQVKLPRIVRSVIRGFQVKPTHRSAQYIPPIDYVGLGVLEAPQEKKQQDAMSELGFSHAPAPWTHGGVLVEGEIRRDAALNFAALRALRAGDDTDPLPLRRYILGLSLVAFTAPQETFLREGCQLVPDPEHKPQWWLMRHDGSREEFTLTHEEALKYAEEAAEAFGVGPNREATFDPTAARDELRKSKQERKQARRGKSTESEASQ